jgi:hypothetical protein
MKEEREFEAPDRRQVMAPKQLLGQLVKGRVRSIRSQVCPLRKGCGHTGGGGAAGGDGVPASLIRKREGVVVAFVGSREARVDGQPCAGAVTADYSLLAFWRLRAEEAELPQALLIRGAAGEPGWVEAKGGPELSGVEFKVRILGKEMEAGPETLRGRCPGDPPPGEDTALEVRSRLAFDAASTGGVVIAYALDRLLVALEGEVVGPTFRVELAQPSGGRGRVGGVWRRCHRYGR